MTELIIAEKPAAAKKIAEALGSAKKEAFKNVPFYRVTHEGKQIIVGSAVGHLFGLAEKEKKGFTYPAFDIEWKPTYIMDKGSAFTKPYYEALKKLCKEADDITIATDFDVEGEVIGWNVVRFACGRKDAKRMKFSTLTKPDLQEAYEHRLPTLEWGQAEAGETRHFLDFYYGINLSRALTSSIKAAGFFKILSTGRVQGPALKIIVDREREILAFKPTPFWQIELTAKTNKQTLEAWHKDDKFWEKPKAEAVMQNTAGQKTGTVAAVEKRAYFQNPPVPFDLTTLQTESYRVFGISPKATLEIAQSLYIAGWISYPRTSSQQLPPALGFAKIIQSLSRQEQYSELCSAALKTPLKPYNGKKTDPAHPAIYPTGIAPEGLEARQAKVYDLIVKRFLATFGQPAKRETNTVEIHVNTEPFIAKGTRTLEPGWHRFYAPYVKLEEIELPPLEQGQKVSVEKITLHDLQTQPPKRFTQSSIIRELERRELGTKATRAEIIDTLYRRNYAKGENLEATELGMHIIDVLEKYSPKILDEELTRHFEREMESIRERRTKGEVVLGEAKTVLTKLLREFKEQELAIGEGLRKTFADTKMTLTRVGKCPNCVEGHLVLKKGKFGRFVACDKYPDCTTTFKMPMNGLIEVTPKICEHCQHPIVKVIRKAKKPQEVCINQLCPSKAIDESLFKERKCPKCKEGDLILRRSIYGAFIACKRFPKCRYLERIRKPGEPEHKTAKSKQSTVGSEPALVGSKQSTGEGAKPAAKAIKRKKGVSVTTAGKAETSAVTTTIVYAQPSGKTATKKKETKPKKQTKRKAAEQAAQ
ncbi:DNA topoisomerase I [Candidatus Woesearchaeota archaeon]|nr:DNA topoisomerase I [Candidatus Woesearchaeota archaeon]